MTEEKTYTQWRKDIGDPMTPNEITAELLERANRIATKAQQSARQALWLWGVILLFAIPATVLLFVATHSVFAQSGQHGREYRDGCGNRYVDMVENDSIESRVPLPPRVCKKVDKGLPTERLVIIGWKQDGFREIPQ